MVTVSDCCIGTISRLQWANAMSSVLSLSLPWLKIQTYVVKADNEGRIPYQKFLDRYKLKMKR